MTPEIFAEWMRRQGRCVVRTESTYWHSQGPGAYQAFPYHWVIQPSGDELLQFMRENRVLALRYSAPADGELGYPSYHAVRDDPNYDFNSLSQWTRKNVRRGFRNCSVEPVSFERLVRDGWELQSDTLARQGRGGRVPSGDEWRSKCLAAAELPGFEAWAALAAGKLAASVISFRMEDCCYLLDQQCHRAYLTAHVNNALSFSVTSTLLKRPAVRTILYALHSLDAPASIDEFKFRMGYRAKPVRQRVMFHPWLSPLMNVASHSLLKFALALRPGNPRLSKAEGMLRFYLQRQPATGQKTIRPGLQDLEGTSGLLTPVGCNHSACLRGSADCRGKFLQL